MWIDDIDSPEGSEWWSEKASEQSEKQREKAKKAASQFQKTQKDEKKWKKNDTILADIIRTFLQNPQYDTLRDFVVPLLHIQVPSSFIIAIISLVFPHASNVLRKEYGEGKYPLIHFNPVIEKEVIPFNENTLDIAIRNRINEWIEDMNLSMNANQSILLADSFAQKLRENREYKQTCIESIKEVFVTFLWSLSIDIPPQKAESYAVFIVGEIEKDVHHFLDKIRSTSDGEILSEFGEGTSMNLFGFSS